MHDADALRGALRINGSAPEENTCATPREI
jgi:hypothetical protein